MKISYIAMPLLALALTGCAIEQTVRPVAKFDGKEVCVVENPDVQEGFLKAYKKALLAKSYTIRQLPATASKLECAVTSTYDAHWHWDLAMYMSFAEIKVFNNGNLSGEAKYDATQGGGNLSKFIKAESKINELVDLLFPVYVY